MDCTEYYVPTIIQLINVGLHLLIFRLILMFIWEIEIYIFVIVNSSILKNESFQYYKVLINNIDKEWSSINTFIEFSGIKWKTRDKNLTRWSFHNINLMVLYIHWETTWTIVYILMERWIIYHLIFYSRLIWKLVPKAQTKFSPIVIGKNSNDFKK